MSKEQDDPKGYEFSEDENAQIAGLVREMRFVGRLQPVLAVLLVAGTVVAALSQAWGMALVLLSLVAFHVFVSKLVLTAAGSLDSVVRTEGDDVAHLMRALGQLARMFGLQRLVIIVVCVLVGLATAFMALQAGGGTTSYDGTEGAPAAPTDGTR